MSFRPKRATRAEWRNLTLLGLPKEIAKQDFSERGAAACKCEKRACGDEVEMFRLRFAPLNMTYLGHSVLFSLAVTFRESGMSEANAERVSKTPQSLRDSSPMRGAEKIRRHLPCPSPARNARGRARKNPPIKGQINLRAPSVRKTLFFLLFISFVLTQNYSSAKYLMVRTICEV